MENHVNLNADALGRRGGGTPAQARSPALGAIALIAIMVVGLGISLTLT